MSKMLDRKVRTRWDRQQVINMDFETPEDARTQQQFKAECDVNNIVERARAGVMPSRFARGKPMFEDVSNVPTLTEAYEQIARAEEAFMTLPATLRAELRNDPRNVSTVSREQLEKHGLIRPSEPSEDGSGLVETGTPSPAGSKKPKASPKAGQAATAGTEPADG